MNQERHPPLRLSWAIWGLGAALYLIGFYQRVAPGVMTAELMSEFALSAAALGNLSAFYFYSYVAMQVPTGVLADHWGPRRLLTLGAAVASVGTLVFAMAPDAAWAGFGRLLIGGSVAVAFVGMLKLAGHWLPTGQYALASGMALFCGIIGAVFAGVPLRILVDGYGWRPVMLVSAMLTCGIAVAIWLLAALLHGPALARDFDVTTPALPEVAATLVKTVATLTGLGLLCLLALAGTRRRAVLAFRRLSTIDTFVCVGALAVGTHLTLAPRPPPSR